MTDLEMTKLCAQSMGLSVTLQNEQFFLRDPDYVFAEAGVAQEYSPLHNSGQAVDLLKRWKLNVEFFDNRKWTVFSYAKGGRCVSVENADLNRAIVECVAKMQKGKK